MKRYIVLQLFVIFGVSALAQNGTVDFTLKVLDTNSRPIGNKQVEFVELSTNKKLYQKTDANGQLKILLNFGKVWQYNIDDIRNYYDWQVEIKEGQNRFANHTVTYDFVKYERETRPLVNRNALNLTKEKQNIPVSDKPTKDLAIVRVTVLKANKTPLGNFPIQLTCYKLRKTYETETGSGGVAYFKVPIGQEYEIDIDGISSFSCCDVPNQPNVIKPKQIIYEPTIVKETVVNDTIFKNCRKT